MADPQLTIKRNDTWPPLVGTLFDLDGVINLSTAAEVKLILKSQSHTISGTCEITDPDAGLVTYVWAVGDTQFEGDYQGEFEITWEDDNVETVPNGTYFEFTIAADLG